MKLLLLALTFLTTSAMEAQTDTLPSGIYNLDKLSTPQQPAKKTLNGSTTDLLSLKVHSTTLPPGKTNHPPRALDDLEELIIVKDGELKVILNDSSKLLSAGSFVLIAAGDQQSFQNVSDKPVTYFVFAFKANTPVNILRGKQAGGSVMKDWDEFVVRKTDKGESRPGINKPSTMFERIDVHATTLNVGYESHPPHTHRSEEIMFMMNGNATMNIGGKLNDVASGDIILVRPEVPHNIKNTGDEQCWYYAIQWQTIKN